MLRGSFVDLRIVMGLMNERALDALPSVSIGFEGLPTPGAAKGVAGARAGSFKPFGGEGAKLRRDRIKRALRASVLGVRGWLLCRSHRSARISGSYL